MVIINDLQGKENTFRWTDSIVKPGQKRFIYGWMCDVSGPCSVGPCYNFHNNYFYYDSLINFLEKNPKTRIEVSSHTDQRGKSSRNKLISEWRSKTVVSELYHQGVDTSLVRSIGHGSKYPLIKQVDINTKKTNPENEELYQINRRYEITILR